jgi:tRNA threonylcarbamoyladenosine biosynthesis protein TsaB
MNRCSLRLLALDTAAGGCSTAVWIGDGAAAWRATAMHRGHVEALIPMVDAVMDETALAFGDLDGIAVTVGPGAFTGLRVGLSAARAIALAARLPCFGVTTLEAVAAAAAAKGDATAPILVALDSRRTEVYAQMFDSTGRALGAMAAETPGNLVRRLTVAAVTLAGDAVDVLVPALSAAGVAVTVAAGPGHPDARMVAGLAAGRWRRGERSGWRPAPLYLRPPDANPPAAGGRRRP